MPAGEPAQLRHWGSDGGAREYLRRIPRDRPGPRGPGFEGDDVVGELHDPLEPVLGEDHRQSAVENEPRERGKDVLSRARIERSEEHTSELQSRFDIVCRLLLEK